MTGSNGIVKKTAPFQDRNLDTQIDNLVEGLTSFPFLGVLTSDPTTTGWGAKDICWWINCGTPTAIIIKHWDGSAIQAGQPQYGQSTYITRITADYTISYGNEVVFATGTLTITLALASKEWTIKIANSSTGIITIVGAGTDTIEGATTVKLTGQYQTITLIGDGVSTYVEF